MTSATHAQPSELSAAEADKEMKQYGIVRVPADFFEYGGYRYTNLQDAVAEARRHPCGDIEE
ncbi:MAG TPA: hypothetical protein VGD10_10165 [Allosphingosinicella sp.]|uniref:hypothetical protein n=1 Tax=Allosphingosinicella sp. TaxID=2823234 RepID=UPI002EDAE420